MRRDGVVAAAILGPIVLGAAFSSLRLLTETFDVPSDESYVQAATWIQAEIKSGDAIAILPAWSLRPLVALKSAGLAARVLSGDHLSERPLQRFSRLYLVTEPDSDGEAEAMHQKYGAAAQQMRFGRLQVSLFDLGGRRVTTDFTASIQDAQIRILDAAGKEKVLCNQKRPGGFGCKGRKSWQRVTRERLLVSENSDVALWAHPPPKGETLEIAFDDVELGGALIVRAGHTRDGADKAHAPVVITVMVDDVNIADVSRQPVFHFRPTTLKVPTGRHRVRFLVHSPNNGGNHFAFDAFSAAPETWHAPGAPAQEVQATQQTTGPRGGA